MLHKCVAYVNKRRSPGGGSCAGWYNHNHGFWFDYICTGCIGWKSEEVFVRRDWVVTERIDPSINVNVEKAY